MKRSKLVSASSNFEHTYDRNTADFIIVVFFQLGHKKSVL